MLKTILNRAAISISKSTRKPSLIKVITDEIKVIFILFSKLKQQQGPMTFAAFWNKALLHPELGYYMKKDVFNKQGDFITSVEISQMFNELIAVWIIYSLQTLKIVNLSNPQANQPFHIIEFGPGLGTLSTHIVRVMDQFKLLNKFQLSYIEFSDFMRKKQQQNITKQFQKHNIYMKYQEHQQFESFSSENITLRWFKTYSDLINHDFGEIKYPTQSILDQAPVIILAHEFYDALPVNIFEYQNQSWKEKLVDINPNETTRMKQPFQFILQKTENIEKILKPSVTFSEQATSELKDGDAIEVCTQGQVIVNQCAEMIRNLGGAGLIIDYGENHAFSDSVRAIANHKILPNEAILQRPGECDLSAYVNFKALGHAAEQIKGIKVPQLLPQGLWLESMGITARLQMLEKNSNQATAKRLETEYQRLTQAEQMGEIFKFMAIQNKDSGNQIYGLTQFLIANLFPFIDDSQQIYY